MSTETDSLADIIGGVAFREFEAAPEWSKDKLRAWCEALPTLGDDEFFWQAASAIHGSALVNSFRGNWDHEHCKGSAVYHEAQRRHVAAGHANDCRADTIYVRAWNQVAREQGHASMIRERQACSCGQGSDVNP